MIDGRNFEDEGLIDENGTPKLIPRKSELKLTRNWLHDHMGYLPKGTTATPFWKYNFETGTVDQDIDRDESDCEVNFKSLSKVEEVWRI